MLETIKTNRWKIAAIFIAAIAIIIYLFPKKEKEIVTEEEQEVDVNE